MGEFLFLSTLSLRRATTARKTSIAGLITSFLSTLSLRRATGRHCVFCRALQFLSTLSLRRATAETAKTSNADIIFLSTLSLRRATQAKALKVSPLSNFYPRSPCGERLRVHLCQHLDPCISIHALLAESDIALLTPPIKKQEFLSTLSLRRATTSRLHKILADWGISIHALLAESDRLA